MPRIHPDDPDAAPVPLIQHYGSKSLEDCAISLMGVIATRERELVNALDLAEEQARAHEEVLKEREKEYKMKISDLEGIMHEYKGQVEAHNAAVAEGHEKVVQDLLNQGDLLVLEAKGQAQEQIDALACALTAESELKTKADDALAQMRAEYDLLRYQLFNNERIAERVADNPVDVVVPASPSRSPIPSPVCEETPSEAIPDDESSSVSSSDSGVDALESRIATLQEICRQKVDENKELEVRCLAVEELLAAECQKVKSMAKTHEETIAQWKQQYRVWKDEMDEARRSEDGAKQRASKLKKLWREIAQERYAQNAVNDDLNHQLAAAKEEAVRLTAELERAHAAASGVLSQSAQRTPVTPRILPPKVVAQMRRERGHENADRSMIAYPTPKTSTKRPRETSSPSYIEVSSDDELPGPPARQATRQKIQSDEGVTVSRKPVKCPEQTNATCHENKQRTRPAARPAYLGKAKGKMEKQEYTSETELFIRLPAAMAKAQGRESSKKAR
ncbi:hypothetical protein BV25DRAFT_1912254 [Artomyces pyxidatus]|uniref:Uncharacterized protein n=1 Tax=Artomyces pyxidatus TaxID=48021 RepID=A0ACB8TER0_9AGAM|nr:hypothetical protein BV25DRAFT_1912254 [Artomyces pyxidatus]